MSDTDASAIEESVLASETTIGPADSPHLLFCGGFHSSMAGTKASMLADYARQRKIGYTRFDYRGHGETPGALTRLHLGHWLDDTVSMIDASPLPLVLIGSSMGAWLSVLATQRRPDRVAGVLLLAAAPDFLQELVLAKLSPGDRLALDDGQCVWIDNRYDDTRWPVHPSLIESGHEHAVLNADPAPVFDCPLRLIHGLDDRDVPWSQSVRLLEAVHASDASLLLLKGQDHRLSDASALDCIRRTLDELLDRLANGRTSDG